MPSIELDLLKRLIDKCQDNEVCCLAAILALRNHLVDGRANASKYSKPVSDLLAEARYKTQPMYRRLLLVVESQPDDVSQALEAFLAEEDARRCIR